MDGYTVVYAEDAELIVTRLSNFEALEEYIEKLGLLELDQSQVAVFEGHQVPLKLKMKLALEKLGPVKEVK